MSLLNRCHYFYQQYVTRYDRALFLLVLINASCGGIYLLVNLLTYQYVGINFTNFYNVIIVPPTLSLVFLSMYLRQYIPNITLITHTFGFLFTIILALTISDNGIQLTPFNPIDRYIVAFDHLFNFNSIAILQWTKMHIGVQRWLDFTYNSLMQELLLLPLLISLLRLRLSCRIYLMSAIIGYIFIQAIYYLFPTIAPAGFFHSHLFLKDQHSCMIKFNEIHHHQPLTQHNASCLIAFPSPHVFCACITWYACKDKWWLWVPIGIINLSMIAATMLLGFHYLADVIGGITIAATSIALAHRIDRWCMQDKRTHEMLNAGL